MKKWKVLITAEHIKNSLSKFHEIFDNNDIEVDVHEKNKLTEEELLPIIHKYDGVITVADEFTPKVLDNAKKLKVISKWGTGINTIDKDYAEKLNIRVCNTANAFSEPLSDTVMGFILCFARRILENNNEIKEGLWNKTYAHALDELTLGIIGLGNCGLAVARKASAFGMKILGNDLKEIPKEILEKYNITLATKDEIYYKSDFITLHTDLNESTKHLIKLAEFEKMKKSAVLINTSRGAVVKTDDLVKALEDGLIRGAAIDVFEEEPLPKHSPLKNLNNCILSPHNSNSSYKYWGKVHENTLTNLIKGLRN